MTFQPITPNWLSATFDQFMANDPELVAAYDYPDYPSEMTGEGNWVDIYVTETNDFPIGRLWVNPETDNIGLEQLEYSNPTYLTRLALELRELNYHDVPVLQAYDFIRSAYFANEQDTGDLANAKVVLNAG